MSVFAVIMAGGSGKRFWPLSRSKRPKQLLAIAGERTMIEETVERAKLISGGDHVLIITNAEQAPLTKEVLRDSLPPEQIIAEPTGRDTAACIGLAALMVQRADPEGVMVVMPADHVVTPSKSFARTAQAAAKVASREPVLVTFGILPTAPATGYGYIKASDVIEEVDSIPVRRVEQFREKPNRETAQTFIDEGSYFWNSGVFVWQASVILDLINEFLPEHAAALRAIREALGAQQEETVIAEHYPTMPKISIDFGVMEKAPEVRLIEAQYQWDDVGGWLALSRLRRTDEEGNTAVGLHFPVDTEDTIVHAHDGHLVATLGVRDLVIVTTPDATLVAHKNELEALKKIVDGLNDAGHSDRT